MTYLLDTGVLLRGALYRSTVPQAIRNILDEPSAQFGLSTYSLWEIGKKVQKGKLKLPNDLPTWFDDVLVNVSLLPIDKRTILEAMNLPDFPNHDPGDELIVATARIHRLTLVTSDKLLKNYRYAQIKYFKPKAT